MTSTESETARASAALSERSDTVEATREACQAVKQSLAAKPTLAVVFATFHHQPHFDELAKIVHDELGAACAIGCTGESIACNAREVEGGAAISVWAAHLPGTTCTAAHLDFAATSDGGSFVGWPDNWEQSLDAGGSLLLLAEPFTFPADVLLSRLNEDRPALQIVGGMASGGWGPGQNRLLLDGRAFDRGAIAVLVQGATRVRSVVSQGCKPVGKPLIVTKADRNVILELGGRPALAQLQDVFGTLSEHDQHLIRQGLHVGQVINEYQDTFDRGDFLIRNVQGADPQTGAIGIGDYARVGQTVQFHVRDATTADEDLNSLLTAAQTGGSHTPIGALLFTCNGRGTRLFDGADHDAGAVTQHWPNLPLAGFFAQGEIGPVGGKNFLHGFTASVALFEQNPKQ